MATWAVGVYDKVGSDITRRRFALSPSNGQRGVWAWRERSGAVHSLVRLRSIREKFLAQDLCGGRSRGRVEGEHFIHDCAAVEWQHMRAESWCVRGVSGGVCAR